MSLLRFFRRSTLDAERALEMREHLELQIADYIADGMTPDQARREAHRRFGNDRAIREDMDQMNAIALLDTIVRDARYAARVLLKTPVFTLTAVLTLALAIAANTAVFCVVDAVLLKPLPFPDADRLALVSTTRRAEGAVSESTPQHGLTWQIVRDHATTVERAVFSTWPTGVNVVAGGRAVHVRQQRIGSGFLRVLGMAPFAGREFTPEEDRAGGPPAAILSYALWRSLFNGDPSVIGRAIVLRGESATVVGVMPEGFNAGARADLWTPLRATVTGEGEGENYAILARLTPGASWTEARAEMQRLGEEVLRQRPAPEVVSMTWGLQPLQRGMTADLRQPLLLLWTAVAVVLLVACVNLAGLLLARSAGRTREIATRMALGGGRGAVIGQLLVESLLLAAVGAVGGLALGTVALEGLRVLAADAFEIWQPIALDGRAVAVALLLSAAASMLFGLAPALQATRLGVQAALTETGARTIAGGSARWPRRILVVAQVALGVVLLAGAGLLVRTFTHLRGLDPGFDPAGVTTATVSLQDARYRTAAAVEQMFGATLERLRQSPGVESAAVTLGVPYERLLNLGFRHLDGPEASAPRGRMTNATYIAGDFFAALRIPLRAGRTFDDRDRAASPGVAIVSETFARQYFEDGNAIGHRIAVAGREREIVGVVGDVQVRPGWGDNGPLAAMPLTYIPLTQANDALLRLVHGWFSPALVVRSSGPAEATASALRGALDVTDPLLPFADVRSMADVQSAAVARQRFLMGLLVGLAVAAVILAALGIHGLIATSVSERTRELGIRLALGASMSQAVRTVVLPGIALAIVGIAIGSAAALGLVTLLRSFIWGVSATDPLTFAAVAAVLLIVATIASVVPALKILRVDPARTLRA
jgi:predicted permease